MHILKVQSGYGRREFEVQCDKDAKPTDDELLEFCGYVPFLGGRVENRYDGKYLVIVHSN